MPENKLYKRLFISLILIFGFYSSIFALDTHLQAFLNDFEEYAKKEQKKWQVPGMAIGIVKGDKVILAKGYGQRGLQDTTPVDKSTLFQIGSLSKAFTSALVAIANDKGQLEWNNKIGNFLPEFQLADPWVTREFEITDLLCQRSGLPQYAGDGQSFLGYTAQEMIHNLRFIKPISSFRSEYAYQNIFFVVAAEILKTITGHNYNELLQKEIFNPLNMQDSSAGLEDYLKDKNSAEWLLRNSQGKVEVLSRDFKGREWNYILGPAGGINSNIKDMVKWLSMQMNEGEFNGKQVISKANMSRMQRPFTYVGDKFNAKAYYGLGWLIQEYAPYPIIWHNGATQGVYNVAAFIPQEKIGIVILSNTRNTQLSLALAFQFFDLYFNKKGRDWSQEFFDEMLKREKTYVKTPASSTEFPSLPLERYTGTYSNSIFNKVEVHKKDNELELIIGKNATKLKLNHLSHDTFFLTWPNIEDGNSKVYFYSNGDSTITTMDIELFSKEGDGIFDKRKET